MKFKMPCLAFDPDIHKIVSKELREQKIEVLRASKANLKELAEVALAITTHGLPKHLVRKKLPHGMGYGIFLRPDAKPIVKDQIIAPYTGEISFVPHSHPGDSLYTFEPLCSVRLTKEEQARFNGNLRYHPRRFYSMCVDALKTGNFTRFINHSEKPNLVSHLFKIPSNSFGIAPSPIEIIYLAKKTIRPGEQLLISYEGEENSYWSALGIKPIPITPRTFKVDSSLRLIGSIRANKSVE